MIAENLLIRGAFARAAGRYDNVADYQREAATRLLACLPVDLNPATVLDAGCGTGHGLMLMAARWPQARLVGVDFALPMLLHTPSAARRVCADAEQLPLANSQFDLYWSNLAMQWCDAHRFVIEARRIMRAGASFAVTTLGPATFAELSRSFSGVDNYQHTNEFIDAVSLRRHLADAGLTISSFQQVEITRHFPDLRSLLASVRELGANRVLAARRRPGLMGKAAWQRFSNNYERLRNDQGLPLTYDTFFVVAQK